MITPSRFHDPPRGTAAVHSVLTGPPVASILFSLPPAKNPMKRLSGDQNGKAASSVPASGCALKASSGRTHKRLFPDDSEATNARRSPSGESANEPKPVFSGGLITARIIRASVGVRQEDEKPRATPSTIAAMTAIAATDARISSLLFHRCGGSRIVIV